MLVTLQGLPAIVVPVRFGFCVVKDFPHRTLASVAAHLPFHLDETERANTAFRRWRQHDDDEARRIVDLWTYCYVRRYFLYKRARATSRDTSADVEALIEKTFLKVQENLNAVSDATRYTHWVSVVCKRTYLNYRRTQLATVSVDQDSGPVLAVDAPDVLHDPNLARIAVRQAIERLPPFLREVARLRLLEGRSYEEIHKRTGKPIASVRTFVNKARVKIRTDEEFLALIREV